MNRRLVLLLLISWYHSSRAQTDATANSCEGICGRPYIKEAPCQCDDQCDFFQNCCKDADSLCNVKPSCAKSCRKLLPDNSACTRCSFFSNGCVTDDEISQFTISIWRLSAYTPREEDFEIDKSGEKLFKSVSERVLELEPFVRIKEFFDNYDQDWEDREPFRVGNKEAEMKFIQNFLSTEIGRRLYRFLKNKNLFGCGFRYQLKQLLRKIWMNKFKRNGSRKVGSNGFENVFAGEINDGVGIGLNNWLRAYELEKAGKIKLQSRDEMENLQGLQHVRYDRSGNIGVTTLFIGVTPEWEFAVFTLCHLARPDRGCKITAEDWNGNQYNVTLRSQYKYGFKPMTETTHYVSEVKVLG